MRIELRTCLFWIRYLRRLRREGSFGQSEKDALAWNFAEARRLANRLKDKR